MNFDTGRAAPKAVFQAEGNPAGSLAPQWDPRAPEKEASGKKTSVTA